jgi:predicted nucleic acid-binding protein
LYDRDDPEQSGRAEEAFLRAKRGEIELFCGPPVFFEVAWVLASVYLLSDVEIFDALETMLYTPNLRVIDGDRVKDAIELARRSQQGYADSYIAITAQRLDAGVMTFNRKYFSKLGAHLLWLPYRDCNGQ